MIHAQLDPASGLAWVGERLAVVQDDANCIALVDPASGLASSVVLPAGADGALLPLKVEGNACGRADQRQAYVVLDVDDPDAPSMLYELALEGPWPVPDAPA